MCETSMADMFRYGQAANEGGMTIDNNETPGCEGPNLNCYPLKWTTIPELYEAAGVSWQLYQDTDNFDDNPLAWFQQYQTAANGSELQKKGMSYIGLEKFYEDAASGNLPQVSIIVGPAELSEHPPYTPRDGAWLQQRIVDTVTKSPQYNSTALIISYDETGGWGDHVVPYHSPQGTTGEWVEDPYGEYGYVCMTSLVPNPVLTLEKRSTRVLAFGCRFTSFRRGRGAAMSTWRTWTTSPRSSLSSNGLRPRATMSPRTR